MDFTRDLYKQTEYQFALNFDDPKQKSSMVGLTAGAECKQIGITTRGVKSQIVAPKRRAASKATTRQSFFNQSAKRNSLLGSSAGPGSSSMGLETTDGGKHRASKPVFLSMASTKFSSAQLRPYSSAVRLRGQDTESGTADAHGPLFSRNDPLSSQQYDSTKQLNSSTFANENNHDYQEKPVFGSTAPRPTASQKIVMDKTRRFLMAKPEKGSRFRRQKAAGTASVASGHGLRSSAG